MGTKRITIFGATGTSASATARKFLEAGWDVRAVTRDKESAKARKMAGFGAVLMKGDLDNRASLHQTLEGSDAVYFAGPSLGNRWDVGQAVQGINAVDAAAEVGIGHFIYQSALVSSGRGVLSVGSKRAIEERLAELPLRSTVLRPTLFMDNFVTYFPLRRVDGELVLAMAVPADKIQTLVAVDDIGRSAVAVAAAPERYAGSTLDLVGDTLTFAQMAAVVQEVTGIPARALSVPLEALEEGWPQGVSLYRWLTERELHEDVQAMPNLLGNVTTFQEWVRVHIIPTLTETTP